MSAGSQGAYFEVVFAYWYVAETQRVVAGRIWNPRAVVDAVFVDDIVRMAEIEQRKVKRQHRVFV